MQSRVDGYGAKNLESNYREIEGQCFLCKTWEFFWCFFFFSNLAFEHAAAASISILCLLCGVKLICNVRLKKQFPLSRKRKLDVPNRKLKKPILGSGCGAVGRTFTSDTRDLRFESSHSQLYLLPINCNKTVQRR